MDDVIMVMKGNFIDEEFGVLVVVVVEFICFGLNVYVFDD